MFQASGANEQHMLNDETAEQVYVSSCSVFADSHLSILKHSALRTSASTTFCVV